MNISNNIKITYRIFLTLVFSFSSIMAYAQQKNPPNTIDDGLILNENSVADLAYVREGMDLSKYKNIFLRPLTVTTEARDATPSRGATRGSWIIPEKDVELMEFEFAKIMTEEFEKGGFSLVDGPGKDTLIIAASIVDIFLTAPIESTRAYRGRTFTILGGSLTIAAAFADGEDFEVLAQVVDTKRSTSYWRENTRASNIADMRRIYRSWGRSVVNKLTEGR